MTSLSCKDDVGLYTTMMFSTTVCPACGKLRSADQLTLCLCGGMFCGIDGCPSHIDCPCGIAGCDLPSYVPALACPRKFSALAYAVLVLLMLTGLGWVHHEYAQHHIVVHHTDLLPGYGYAPIPVNR